MNYFRMIQIAIALVLIIMASMMPGSTSITCADAEIPYTFSPGQTISSAKVNANFQALLTNYQELSTKIQALQAQLAPVSPASIVGIYDYVAVGEKMLITQGDYGYEWMQSGERGTFVFAANGTFTINPTDGGYYQMAINNEISPMVEGSTSCNPDWCNSSSITKRDKSLLSGFFSQGGTEAGEGTYAISGSTVTMSDGTGGSLSADGKTLILNSFDSSAKRTGLAVAIRRPPTITNATSSTADGRYNAGASINITLNFSEAVTSTGLTIALNSGATITTGAISNVPIWSGTYTVGTGQASSDLSVSAVTGTIATVYSASNPTIPAGKNIGDSKAIVIE